MRAAIACALCTGCTSLLGISDPTPATGDGGPDTMIDSNIDAPPPCTTSIALKPEQTLDLGKQGFDLVVGSFNTDAGGTKLDVAIAAGDEVLIYLGDNTGAFANKMQVPTAATGIALEDYDGVGFDDLALWTDGGTSVKIRIQNRANTPPFNAEQTVGTFTTLKHVIGEQLDGNLRADILAFDSAAGSRVFTSNAAPGTFSQGALVGVGADELVLMKQVDGNQRSDALFVNGPNVRLSLQTNAFQALNTIATGAAGKGVAFGKFDGDALLDLVVSTANGLMMFKQTSPGMFAAGVMISPLSSATPMHVLDLNNDGRDDIVLPNAVILQCAPPAAGMPGVFTQVEALAAARPSIFADVTGDGKPDLLRLEGNSLKVRTQ